MAKCHFYSGLKINNFFVQLKKRQIATFVVSWILQKNSFHLIEDHSRRKFIQWKKKLPLERVNSDPWNQEKVFDREGTSAFLQNGGLVPDVDRRRKVLCRLGKKEACHTNYIADSIDMMYAFTPLYAVNQQVQSDLYQLHDEFVGYMHSIGIPHLTY